MNAIVFPKISTVAFSIFGFAIYWYAMAYMFGTLFGAKLLKVLNKRNKIFSPQALEDSIVFAVMGILIGGRMGYVIFYDFHECLRDPIKIVMLRIGGMSFHGGMLGLAIGLWMLSKKYKIHLTSVFDMVSCVTPIGLFLGRLANFINSELYGRVTDVAWGVSFPNGGPFPRHPSQLYEAFFEGIVLFIIMLMLFYRTKLYKKPGILTGIFLIIYAIMRISIENFREPDIQLGFFLETVTMGQILCLPMIILGSYFIWANTNSRN